MAPEKLYLRLVHFFSTFPYQIAVDFSWPMSKLGLGQHIKYLEYAGGCELSYGEFNISNA